MLSLCLLLCGIVCVHSQATCTAGDTSQTSGQFSSSDIFAVNLNSSSCAGTVVTWHYCFHTDGVSSGDTYEFGVAMFRVSNGGNLRVISASIHNFLFTGSSILEVAAGSSFACDTLSLSAAEQFEVQEGSVVGACIRDLGSSSNPLRIFSENVTRASSTVVTANPSECTSPLFIANSSLDHDQSGMVLHLYVDIEMPPSPSQESCSLGTETQERYTRTHDDLFLLDVNHPAQCDGTVESLSYCVYRRRSIDILSDFINFPFQAFAAVFRPEANGVYTRVSNFTTLSQDQFDIDGTGFFGCFDQAAPLTVQTGDVLGVCQVDAGSFIGRLNVIGTGAPSGNSLYVANASMNCGNMDQTLSVNIEDGSLQAMDGYVMHVHANISGSLVPSTTPDLELTPSTSSQTHDNVLPTSVPTNPSIVVGSSVMPTGVMANPPMVVRGSVPTVILIALLCALSVGVITGVMVWRRFLSKTFAKKPHITRKEAFIINHNINVDHTNKAAMFTEEIINYEEIDEDKHAKYAHYKDAPQQKTRSDRHTITEAECAECNVEEMEYSEIEVGVKCTDNVSYATSQQKHAKYSLTKNVSYDKTPISVDEGDPLKLEDGDDTCTESTAYTEIDFEPTCTENIAYTKMEAQKATGAESVETELEPTCAENVAYRSSKTDGVATFRENAAYYSVIDLEPTCAENVAYTTTNGEPTCAENIAYAKTNGEPTCAEYSSAEPTCTGSIAHDNGQEVIDMEESAYTSIDEYDYI